MFVKICGITREEDALLAVAMGADALGFNFASGSPRQIAPVLARDIARRLPTEILTVGVFRDEAAARVVEIVNTAGLRAAQLHGRESAEATRWVRILETYDGPSWPVFEVAVIASHLGEGPGGTPRYETLAELPIGG